MTERREIWERGDHILAVYFDDRSDAALAWPIKHDRKGDAVRTTRKDLIANGFAQPLGISRRSLLQGAAVVTLALAITSPTKILLRGPVASKVIKPFDDVIITDFVRLEKIRDPDGNETGWFLKRDDKPKSMEEIAKAMWDAQREDERRILKTLRWSGRIT